MSGTASYHHRIVHLLDINLFFSVFTTVTFNFFLHSPDAVYVVGEQYVLGFFLFTLCHTKREHHK